MKEQRKSPSGFDYGRCFTFEEKLDQAVSLYWLNREKKKSEEQKSAV